MDRTQKIKNAWIDEAHRIISFERRTGSRVFTAGEEEFWRQILTWMQLGYRVC